MKKTMLIDAVHPEETRVALVNDGRIEDFDFESAGKEQLRGNIYLAKVTRVEPSLQACFVEYGGNRHGFLAFSEIHPDYYQLPQADRDALIEEAARAAEEAGDDHDDDDFDAPDEEDPVHADASDDAQDQTPDEDADGTEPEASDDSDADDSEAKSDESGDPDENDDSDTEDETAKTAARPARRKSGARKSRASSISRRYKIQEVIRRRQILLVQVVKEERGNKGAALTTYLSLAGRYSVLMPNTPRGGGISRKIANGNDRKRLKAIMDELDVPKGMGLIVRTAGAKRTKSDIGRDYEYLQKLWNKIRSGTMESIAPSLIHEEGGLVHRAMRDMFDREIEEVVVQGDAAYREAKDLAKVLMPTQARKVQKWTAPTPLFSSEGIEDQLDSIFSPTVQMKSGGYLVINQTEALVAIDVNSGKSTRERSIEQTALRTNLEAADEACRQMRLRDLAGLVVIDFIDMDENKNNRAVEKRMKEALKLDRARVQNSRISQFGLMEISRQRRRAGIMQATSERCETCNGTGRTRSVPSAALQLLRAIENRSATGNLNGITVTAPTEVALFLLNSKRDAISEIEEAAGFTIAIKSSADTIVGDFAIDAQQAGRGGKRKPKFNRADFLQGDEDDHLLPDPDEDEAEESAETADSDGEADSNERTNDREEGSGRKRRRRGRRGGRRKRREDEFDPGSPPSDGGALLDGLSASVSSLLSDEPGELPSAESGGLAATPVATPIGASSPVSADGSGQGTQAPVAAEVSNEPSPEKKRRRRRRKRRDPEAQGTSAEGEAAPIAEATPTKDDGASGTKPDQSETEPAPSKPDAPIPVLAPEVTEKPAPKPVVAVVTPDEPIATAPVLETESTAPKKKRRGWWSKS